MNLHYFFITTFLLLLLLFVLLCIFKLLPRVISFHPLVFHQVSLLATNSISFCLSENVSTLPSFLKYIFTTYRILG